MRSLHFLLAALGLALGACNANPLLSSAASNYAPLTVGSRWDYRSPDGSATLSRQVSARGTVHGRDAYTVDTTLNGIPSGSDFIAWDGGQLLRWDAGLGWILWRRYPLVNNGKWDTPTGNPLVVQTTFVEGIETVEGAPLGDFRGCFKLRVQVETYSSPGVLAGKTETLVWVAPGIGDVRYASLAPDGTRTITYELTGWSIP
jgi:hypothetical protein